MTAIHKYIGDATQSNDGDTDVPRETSHTPGPAAPIAPFYDKLHKIRPMLE